MTITVRVAVALLVGLVVFLVLVPTSGAGSLCYSLLSFQVACDGAPAAVAAVSSAALVGVILWLTGRRRVT